jgi:hypothetical protein
MNVLLGYEDKPADPQQQMMARMAAMMERLETIIDPALARQIASEQVAARPGLHLVTDTLNAIEIPTDF